MANSADPDQKPIDLSTLFAKAGYIQVQHDKGYNRESTWH